MVQRTLKRARLDRFIAHHAQISLREVQRLLAQRAVLVNGEHATSRQQRVSQFDKISIRGEPLKSIEPCYLMLNKPVGVVSATRDAQFQTVIDLVPDEMCANKQSLHYAGRLDRASTGLMLLTNDGHWSRALSDPLNQLSKHYYVTLKNPIKPDDVAAFAQGFFFEYEQQWTHPAKLEVLESKVAKVVINEGKYHQIKRMFAKCGNRVVTLHRYRIGKIMLDKTLPDGGIRVLTKDEIASVGKCTD